MNKDRVQYLYAILVFLLAEVIQSLVIGTGKVLFEDSLTKGLEYIISVIAVLICGIIFLFWYRYDTHGEAVGNIKNVFAVKSMSMLILLGFGCQFLVSGIMSLVEQYNPQLFGDYYRQMKELTSGYSVPVLALILLIAPITEELIFRGMILRKARRSLPFIGANLLQAVLFGVYHWNIVQGIYAALLGFVLGLICRKFGTIIAPMLLHIIINTSSLLMFLFPDRLWLYNIMILIGAISTFTALTVLLTSGTKERRISSTVK